MARVISINGVKVNLDAPDLKDVKDLEGVQKLEIFSHFNEVAKKNSEEELVEAINGTGKYAPKEDEVKGTPPPAGTISGPVVTDPPEE